MKKLLVSLIILGFLVFPMSGLAKTKQADIKSLEKKLSIIQLQIKELNKKIEKLQKQVTKLLKESKSVEGKVEKDNKVLFVEELLREKEKVQSNQKSQEKKKPKTQEEILEEERIKKFLDREKNIKEFYERYLTELWEEWKKEGKGPFPYPP